MLKAIWLLVKIPRYCWNSCGLRCFKMTKQGQDTIKLAVIHQTNVSIFLLPIWKVKWRRNFFVCGLITTPFTTYLACGPLMNSTPFTTHLM
jgi:hypothetical protein